MLVWFVFVFFEDDAGNQSGFYRRNFTLQFNQEFALVAMVLECRYLAVSITVMREFAA
jgi:hypothetical protein